jgi:hypothetical protein
MTDHCTHDHNENCVHCTEGCNYCGDLEVNDHGFCESCQESRNQYRADCIYESMKDPG